MALGGYLRYARLSFIVLAALLALGADMRRAAAVCVGDCLSDGAVTVDEIATLIGIATAQRPVADCTDPNADGEISIEEIVGAVRNSLAGCRRVSQRYLYPGPQLPGGSPVVVTDLNQDGNADIFFLLNDGHGSFYASNLGGDLFGEDRAVADFDEDGRVDFAVSDTGGDVLKLSLSRAQGPGPRLVTGDRPIAVAAGDIDGDGHSDLVSANAGSRDLSLYLGAGDGTFGPVQTFPVDSLPALLEVADLTEDGKAEILLSSDAPARIMILRPDAMGFLETIGLIEASETASRFSQLLIGDRNGDGHPDLLIVDADAGSLHTWLGNGAGAFFPALSPSVPGASAIAVGDFDGDHVDDTAIGTSSGRGEVAIVLGGRPCADICNTFDVGEPVHELVTAELTGDGKLDLAITAVEDDKLTIFEGNGDGTFQGQRRSAYADRAGYKVARINRDLAFDVLRITDEPYGFTTFLRSDDGSLHEAGFTPIAPFTGPPLWTPEWIAFGDFDADGSEDFVLNRAGEGAVHLFWGAGDGAFSEAQPVGVGRVPRAVAAADVNGDGHDDVIAANYESDDLTLLLSKEHRRFDSRTLPAGDGPWRLAIADIDGDEIDDIVSVNLDSKDLSIRLAGADRSYALEKRLRLTGNAGPGAVLARDLNGDHFADLIIGVSVSDFAVILGVGDGTFRSPRLYSALNFFGDMQVADANGDGKLDMFVRDLISTVGLWLGDGRGDFVGPFNFSAGGNVDDIVATDIDGDDVPDLLSSSFTGGFGEIHGSGCGDAPEYAPGYPQSIAYGVLGAVFADLNGDGLLDVVGSGQNGPYVFLASVPGELGLPVAVPDSEVSFGLAVADLDGDGDQDFVTTNHTSNTVSVYSGAGDGSFSRRARIVVGDRPVKVYAGDLNGDTRVDIAALNDGDKSITVLLRSVSGEYENAGTFAAQYPSARGGLNGGLIGRDFDGNGTIDLALPHASGIGILSGAGDGHFVEVGSIGGTASPANSIVAGDYNEDGIEDLASTNAGSPHVTILLGHGDGTFAVSDRIVASSAAAGIDTADIDRDGHLDIVTSNYDSDPVLVVLQGRGDGTFARARRFAGTYFVDSVVLTDFDADGDADVIVTAGSEVLLHAGMLVPCALPHYTRTNLSGRRCSLATAEGAEQQLLCDDSYLFRPQP